MGVTIDISLAVILVIIPPTMSTTMQLKLLTLLNVSATKRPLDVDSPGAVAKFPIRRSNPTSTSSSPVANGDAAEPPRKRKKTVQWNGEIGPSGSGAAAAKGKGKQKVAKAVEHVKGGELPREERDEEQSEEGISLPVLAEADDDAEDDAEVTNGASSECDLSICQSPTCCINAVIPLPQPSRTHSTYILPLNRPFLPPMPLLQPSLKSGIPRAAISKVSGESSRSSLARRR
jgi:hypothetical protein